MSDSPPGAGAHPAAPRVILLEPKRGANVGAVCRAIKNMGAGALVLVGGEFDTDEAERTSVHARDVFAARRQVSSFEEAIAGCSLVVGTTSRSTPWRIPVNPIRQVAAEVLAAAQEAGASGPCGLVFGREDRGLSNEELARCHRLAYVPTADEYASLNLAQAAVVCLYEWMLAGAALPEASASESAERGADAASVAAALQDLRVALTEIGFLSADQPDRVMATIASLLTRTGLDSREVRILRGIARQVRWFVADGAAVAERKRTEGKALR